MSSSEPNISGEALWTELAVQGISPDNGLKKILELTKFDNLFLLSKFTSADEKSVVKLMRNVLYKHKKVNSDLKESMYGIFEDAPESFEFYGGQKKMLDCIIEISRKIVSRKRLAEVSTTLTDNNRKQARLEKSKYNMPNQAASVSNQVSETAPSLQDGAQKELSDLSTLSERTNSEISDLGEDGADSKLVHVGSLLEGNVNKWLLYHVPEISPNGRYEVCARMTRNGFGEPQAKMKCIAQKCAYETTLSMNANKNWATSNLYRHFRTHASTKGNSDIQEFFMQTDTSPIGKRRRSGSNKVIHDSSEEDRIDDVEEVLDSEESNNNDKASQKDFQ